MSDVHARIDAVVKLESARLVGAVLRLVHDVGLAEELVQDALVTALEQWPAEGVPDNPGAWLMAIAKRRAVDHIRRSKLHDRKAEQYARELDQPAAERDDVLRLMVISCHPVLPTEQRAALTLRVVGGLTAAEIARAFLVTEPEAARRIVRAKKTLGDAGLTFEVPHGPEREKRLASVLEVIYLIFNEGYSASSGDDLIRPALCLDALRLGRLLAELAPGVAEVHGLVALMEIQASRTAARTGPAGEPVQLHDQNRGRWDPLLIRRGFTALLRAKQISGTPGPYVLQAAIAVSHAQARTASETDWHQIATLYDALARQLPTPIVQLNRAVAVGMAHGPEAGLELTTGLLADPALRDYHLLPSVRGDLLLRSGRRAEARREFERAAGLARNAAESAFLLRRAAEIAEAEPAGITVGEAARTFLARSDLTPATLRSYGQTLDRMCRALGERVPLAEVTGEQVAQVCMAAWGESAARTWNRHVSAIRSFGTWAAVDLAEGLSSRPSERRTPASAGLNLERLWEREDVALRERTLWRLLHESRAGIGAVLALNVEDLDLDDRRSRNGVTWRAGAARLLEDLVAGRARGPVFLTDRRPGPGRTPAEADRCPETGRSRLSYERAEYLFKQATGTTLHHLKPH